MHLLIKQVAEGEADKLDKFFSVNTYVQGSYTEKSAFDGLNKALLELEKGKTVGNRLIYLALPPSVFEPVTSFIKQSCMSKTQVVFISHTHTHTHTYIYNALLNIFSGWNRIIVEKPFGKDSESSAKLSTHLAGLFTEEEIYRIDHYLGKEMVQNLLVLRLVTLDRHIIT